MASLALITSCTNRKRRPVPAGLKGRELQAGTLGSVAAEWVRKLDDADEKVPARALYAGRSFTEALSAVGDSGANLSICSAGLGLVDAEDLVSPYSLTVVGNDPDNVLRKIQDARVSPSEWWDALHDALGKSQSLERVVCDASTVVLALPVGYVELIKSELSQLSEAMIHRLRVVGLPSLRKVLPTRVAGALIEYDDRFESIGRGFSGTRTDFPQRIARHFVVSVVSALPQGTTAEHREVVSAFLAELEKPVRPVRTKYADSALKDVIRGLWSESGGRVSEGLRLLRRERQIACEQSRFKRLFWEVAAEMRASNA